MRAVHVSIRQIGNSQGVVIPKPVLAQLGLDAKVGVEMTIEDGALVLRSPRARPAQVGPKLPGESPRLVRTNW